MFRNIRYMENNKQELQEQILAVRHFNRFYTKLSGALEDMYLGAPVRLSEARVLYEISAKPGCKAGELSNLLCMDPGYLSRTISCLEKVGLISRKPDPEDRRSRNLHLSDSGQSLIDELGRLAGSQIASLLSPLTTDERRELILAMQQIQNILGDQSL